MDTDYLGQGLPMNCCKAGMVALLLFNPAGVRAAVITYDASFPSASPVTYEQTDWSQTIALPQFNPQLGTLTGVTVQLEAAVSVTQAYENLAPVINTIALNQLTTVTLNLPDSTTLVTDNLKVSSTFNVPAYTGVLNFAGPSGGTVTGLSAQATGSSMVLN